MNEPNMLGQSVCPEQAFPAYCNVKLYLIGPVHEFQRKLGIVNMVPKF